MQIQDFPKWFKEIEEKLLTDYVGTVFSKLDFKIKDLLTDLVTFFGILNKEKIKSLLTRHVIKYENECMRIEQVLSIYLKCMEKSKDNETTSAVINETTIILERAKMYDHLSMYSDIWTCAIKEMAKYILAWSMPLQDSKLRGCYSINWIKINIDADDSHYQNLIMTLFQIRANEDPPKISKSDELLLYKRTAIKIYGKKEISWASYLCKWLRKKDPSNPLLNMLESSALFKVLIKSNSFAIQKRNLSSHTGANQSLSKEGSNKIIISNVNEQKPQLRQNPLKVDLFQDTINNLCHHPKSLLPKSDYFKDFLLKLFESTIPVDRSDRARQSIMCYIEYLEQSYVHDQSETFFNNGLAVLNSLIPDTGLSLYNFLHALLHYFDSLNQSTDEDAKDFLFKSIHFIDFADRKKYDTQIKEFYKQKKFSRQKFKIDSFLMNFVKNHTLTLKQWGKIILRCSRSNGQGIQPCPYLDPEAHLNLVDEIEKLTGLLPVDIVNDLLYFQMASVSGSVFDVLTQFSNLRDLIIKEHLDDDISIPSELYKSLEKLSSLFLDQFTDTLSSDIRKLNDRANTLGLTHIEVNFFLSFTTYPKATVPFCELMPLQIKDKQFIFPKNVLNQIINYHRSIHQSFNFGPSWLVRWEFNEKFKMCEMIVTLTNRFKNNVTSSFRLPIKIPIQNEEESIRFCKLLTHSVDGLGKEALSDEEKSKTLELKLTVKEPSSGVRIYGTPQKKFDQFMEFSPLVKYEFETIDRKDEDSQLAEIKAELFEFVQLLRTSFLQSFYFVLNPEKMSENLSNSCIYTILPRPGGFYLSSALNLFIPEMDKLNSSELHIRNADYLEKFREIYKSIYWDEEKTPRAYEDKFMLCFYADGYVKELPVNLQIENLYKEDQAINCFSDMSLESPEITTKHSRFQVEIPPDASNSESKTPQEEFTYLLSEGHSEKKISETDLVILLNKVKGIPEDSPVNVDKIVQITMNLQATDDDQEPYRLTIKRPLFNDEQDFKDFMLWQIAVVCDDHKDAWLWKF